MNLWITGFTVLTFVTGLLMCGVGIGTVAGLVVDPRSVTMDYSFLDILPGIAANSVVVGLGVGLMALSGFALWRTAFGTRFEMLSPVERIIAVAAAIPGVVAACVVTAGCICFVVPIIIAISSALAAAEREERVREIEEGVRRGMRR